MQYVCDTVHKPGETEDEHGLGYIGQAGELLFSLITQLWGTNMPTIMLGNAVICWPTGNATPTITQIRRCGGGFWPYLLADTDLIADDCLLVPTGASPYKMLYNIADGSPAVSNITSARGRPVELTFSSPTNPELRRKFTLLPTFHPAAALHNRSPERYADIISDFQNVFRAWKQLREVEPGESIIIGRNENTIDLDQDLTGQFYSDMLSPVDIGNIIAEIEADYLEYEDKTVSFDVETKNKNTSDTSNGIRLAGLGTIGRHTYQFVDNAIGSLGEIFHQLKELGYKITGHNIWFDLMMSWKERIFECVDELPDIRDTRVMQKLVDENSMDNKLKFLCCKYFGIEDWSMELNALMDADENLNWERIDMKTLARYHRGDLYWTVRLYYLLAEKCAEEEVSGFWKIDYVAFKNQLHKELIQTSINGFKINVTTFKNQMEEYLTKQKEVRDWFKQPLYQRIVASYNLADKPLQEAIKKTLCNFALVQDYNPEKDVFNPNSTAHIAALLAGALREDDRMRMLIFKGLGRKAKTTTGKVSLNEANIESICEILSSDADMFKNKTSKYAHIVEGVKKVLEYRALAKIAGTYLEGMLRFVWSDWAVRSQWNVDGAATGRLSSARPNNQNIPRGDTAKGIKSIYIPRKSGYIFMQFDLSQAELRGLGSFTHDPNLKHAYDNGLDLHKYTAANIFHVPIEEVVKKQRQISKSINFGISYGANAPTLSKTAGISLEEAEDALQKWHGFYQNVRPWMEERGHEIETQGFVLGLWGLKRRLPMSMAREEDGADLKRIAGNMPIQNFASDFNCFLMLLVMDMVKENNMRPYIRMVNTVHDSIVFEVAEGYEASLAYFYTTAMEIMNQQCAELIGKEYYVWMRGDLEIGLNYGDLHGATIDPDTFEVTLEAED